jgi:hypothetical protein
VRFILVRQGEDPDLAIAAFWKEHRGHWSVVPLYSYGAAPRSELCTARSLAAALQVATIPTEATQKWRAACELHNVAWPRRLEAA